MQHHLKKTIYGLVIVVGIVLALVVVGRQMMAVPPVVVPPPSATAIVTVPKQLLIPKIGVETDIEEVGITDKGKMGIPKDSANVAWYAPGTLPGAPGNAVIAGHLDNFLGVPLVFSKLDELVVGDDIYVITEDGSRVHFKVTGTGLYEYDSLETADVFGPTDERHLNLITCSGTWFQDIKNYDKRLVIFSEAV